MDSNILWTFLLIKYLILNKLWSLKIFMVIDVKKSVLYKYHKYS